MASASRTADLTGAPTRGEMAWPWRSDPYLCNVIGNPIVPVIKITGNPKTVRTMSEHVDVDVSGVLRRDMTIPEAGDALIEMVVRTANGRLTAAESLGHREFVMTKLYRSA